MVLETHVHTRYSKDSILMLSTLYAMCRLRKIDVIGICDHNTIEGALVFQNYCIKRKSKIRVIVGEEIMTTEGEIIGLYLKENIPFGMSPIDTINEIKRQNGVVYIPHPYDEMRAKTVLNEECIKKYSDLIDCIECHNGRNIKSYYSLRQDEIADKYNIKKIVGSDAHTALEIGRNNNVIDCNPVDSNAFINSLENIQYVKKDSLKGAHYITKVAKAIKYIGRGDIDGLYRVIVRKFRRKM